jgi:ABC-2 type transport system ATP-binding protein
MIDVQDLHKSFGQTTAVAGISFSVRAGETFGLLGPNGAGKSTTIAMLTGALAPDRGTIDIGGQGSPATTTNRLMIGVAPQSLSLYEDLTAQEN